MVDVKKAYVNYGYPYQRFADTAKNIENTIVDNGGVEIKPLSKEDFFTGNGFEHKFYNLEGRGTVYLRSGGDWKESEGRRVSSIYTEVHDTDNQLYEKIKKILSDSEKRLMDHEKQGLEEKFD